MKQCILILRPPREKVEESIPRVSDVSLAHVGKAETLLTARLFRGPVSHLLHSLESYSLQQHSQ